MSIPCSECGQIHDAAFSHQLMNLYRDFVQATDQEARLAVVQKIADQLASEHDPTDVETTDDYHQYFEEYETAKLHFEQARTKLARLAVHILNEYVKSNDIDLDTLKINATPN